ncbi:MAG: hypothetical protein DHS20C02_00250 [Micavibrio sp.]|nr:MAG: hypothetical protein DHS20C02_00250 [Micavibrio sp.]
MAWGNTNTKQDHEDQTDDKIIKKVLEFLIPIVQTAKKNGLSLIFKDHGFGNRLYDGIQGLSTAAIHITVMANSLADLFTAHSMGPQERSIIRTEVLGRIITKEKLTLEQ